MRVMLKHILQRHSQVSLAGGNTVRFWCASGSAQSVNGQSKQVISGTSCSVAAACLQLLPLASTGNIVQYNISGRVPGAARLCVQDISGVLV